MYNITCGLSLSLAPNIIILILALSTIVYNQLVKPKILLNYAVCVRAQFCLVKLICGVQDGVPKEDLLCLAYAILQAQAILALGGIHWHHVPDVHPVDESPVWDQLEHHALPGSIIHVQSIDYRTRTF